MRGAPPPRTVHKVEAKEKAKVQANKEGKEEEVLRGGESVFVANLLYLDERMGCSRVTSAQKQRNQREQCVCSVHRLFVGNSGLSCNFV